jgi:hypothetical protein
MYSMGRIGWKGGRFSVDFETSEIYRGLRDWQRWTGDQIYYYRFAYDQSNRDPVYGEATGPLGRVYFGPNNIPALHVVHIEGDNDNTEQGFYYNDRAHVTLSFDQIKRLGLDKVDLNTQNYLKDRFVYDTKVFRVTSVQVLGQIQQKDIIVGIDATQVKPDEMVNDVQFAQYATPNDLQFSQRWSLNDSQYNPYNNGHGIFPMDYQIENGTSQLSHLVNQVTPSLRSPAYVIPPGPGGYGDGQYGSGPYGG